MLSEEGVAQAKLKTPEQRRSLCQEYQTALAAWFCDHADKGFAYFTECKLLQAALELPGTDVVFDETLMRFVGYPLDAEDGLGQGLVAGSHSLIYLMGRCARKLTIDSFPRNAQGHPLMTVLQLDTAGFAAEHIPGISNHAQNLSEVDVIARGSTTSRVRNFLRDLGNVNSALSLASFGVLPGWIAMLTSTITTKHKEQFVRETRALQTREEREQERREEKEKAAQFAKMSAEEQAAEEKAKKKRDSQESETFTAEVRAGVLQAGE